MKMSAAISVHALRNSKYSASACGACVLRTQRRSPGRSPKAFRSRSIRSRSPLRACSCQSRRNANLETFFQVSRFPGLAGAKSRSLGSGFDLRSELNPGNLGNLEIWKPRKPGTLETWNLGNLFPGFQVSIWIWIEPNPDPRNLYLD